MPAFPRLKSVHLSVWATRWLSWNNVVTQSIFPMSTSFHPISWSPISSGKKATDAVGIYANNICYASTRRMLALFQEKRERGEWKGKILVEGPHTSVGAQEIPDFVDHIVIGEGEVSVPKILEGEIKDRILTGEKVEDLDSLPRPTWDKFLSLPYQWSHHWNRSKPLYTMNTSRGCPFGCRFCSVKSIWGKSYRAMSAARVVEDVEHLVRDHGASGIYFREDNFTLSKKIGLPVYDH